jgi:N-methylhydantoinase A
LRQLQSSVQACYSGQVWHLTLPLNISSFESDADVARLVEDFHQLHERTYSVRAPADAVDLVEWNVMAVGVTSPRADTISMPRKGSRAKANGTRQLYAPSQRKLIDCPVFDLMAVAGHSGKISGPALIQEKLTVVYVPEWAKARVLASGDILLTLIEEN